MKLTEKKASATQRVVVYGPPKSGKTYLVGKLAEHYNLLWIDCDNGWTTLQQLPEAWQERINIIAIPDSREFPIAAETLPKIVKGSLVSVCNTHGKVACALCSKNKDPVELIELNKIGKKWIVVVDSLTQLTNSMIAHITKGLPDDYKLEFDDWGKLKVLIEKFLSQIQAAGYNVVCITHEEEVEMEDGKKKIVPSSGSSKSSRNTARYFDHVVYCEVKNKKHTFGSSTDFGMNLITGSRTGIRMENNKEPSLLDIFTSWKDWEHEDAEKESTQSTQDGKDNGKLEHNNETSSSAKETLSNSSSVLHDVQQVDTRTPGQVALENMKLKAAELLAAQKK